MVGRSLTGIRVAAVIGLVLVLSLPLLATAAGLGRLTVLSALGQPLSAEIEIVSLQAGEEESLAVRLAPIEAFRQANIEFNSALVSMRLAIDKRAGKPVVRLTSSQPFQEPFIDLLVELSWTTGRLVREYTFLLDPPEFKAPAPVAASPAAAPVARPEPLAPARPAARIEERPIAAPAAPRAAAPATPRAAGSLEVKKGDTLGRIAAANKPDGVTLQQMLIALYRANRDAFIRDNINLVRAGRILNIPDRDAVASVDDREARGLITSQNADWNEYRRSLGAAVAEAPAGAAPGQQASRGRITAQPDAPKPGEPRDQLRLSKADPSAKAGSSARAAREDDKVARAKALKESESRISDLEKNVSDLNKLVELKNQQLAQLERQGGKPAASAAAAKTPEPAKPAAEAAKPAPVAVPAKPAAEPAKPAPVAEPKASPEPAKPTAVPAAPAAVPATPAAEPSKPSPVAKDAVPPATAKPKPAAALPPPPPEQSLLDEFLDNPIALGGLGAIVVVLAGYAFWAWRRKKNAAESRFADSVLGGSSGLGSASVFSEPGAEPVLVGAAGTQAPSVQPAPAVTESDNVDPIAEADVYMAYGRDAQAEEILKEALAKNPGRTALQLKLLEVYAARKDGRSFEQLLMKLKDGTGGQGPEWAKAMALGHGLDPQNPLYGGAAAIGAMGAAVGAMDTQRIAAAPAPAPSVDFDIGGSTVTDTGGTVDMALDSVATPGTPAASVDFDLGGGAPAGQTDFAPTGTLIMDSKEAAAASSSSGLDFDLGGGDAAPVAQAAPAPAESSGGLDFDLNLDLGDAAPSTATGPAPELDLNSIDLDLGAPGEGGAVPDAKWQEIATRLDLAKAYEEMGDKDGARALLQEVAKDGDAAQRKQAEQMLSGLG